MFTPLRRRSEGFSLAEMVVYVAILTLLLIVIVTLLSGIANSQRRLKAAKTVENSAIFGFDRMVREARNAQSTDTLYSQFGTNPGVLRLNGSDEFNLPRTVEFYLLNQRLYIRENGVDLGPLTPADARVTNLIFRQILTGNSKAVKMEMTVEAGTSTALRYESFYNTAILRGSY